MDAIQRKLNLVQGIALAGIPAVLFFPAVALLTICPSGYAETIMAVILLGFDGSEILAGWKLGRVLRHGVDWLGVGAILGLILDAVVTAGVVWGFIAPIVARRSGY